MFFIFKTTDDARRHIGMVGAIPKRYFVLEKPAIFNYLNDGNVLYKEDIKDFLKWGLDNVPTAWIASDGRVTEITRTSDTNVSITHCTYEQYLINEK